MFLCCCLCFYFIFLKNFIFDGYKMKEWIWSICLRCSCPKYHWALWAPHLSSGIIDPSPTAAPLAGEILHPVWITSCNNFAKQCCYFWLVGCFRDWKLSERLVINNCAVSTQRGRCDLMVTQRRSVWCLQTINYVRQTLCVTWFVLVGKKKFV